jgi:hypothetical protein
MTFPANSTRGGQIGAVVVGALLLMIAITVVALDNRPPAEIVFHIGKTYEAVVQDSSFPVKDSTAFSDDIPPDPDSTWLNRRVTVFRFDDPEHGFTLPPTCFGAVMYRKERVTSMRTSPMLEALPFELAVTLLEELQTTFRNAGWRPMKRREGNDWLDTSSDNRAKLQKELFIYSANTVELVVPGKYGMFLNIKCFDGCDGQAPEAAKYLIDVSISKDHG